MWHNDEITTNWKDSVMTAEEFEEKESVSSTSSHEPPFHPYYQAAMEEGKRLLADSDSEPAKKPTFAGKAYDEWEELYKDLGNARFYNLLAARYYNIMLSEVTSYHIGSTNRAWMEWREDHTDSN